MRNLHFQAQTSRFKIRILVHKAVEDDESANDPLHTTLLKMRHLHTSAEGCEYLKQIRLKIRQSCRATKGRDIDEDCRSF